MPKIKTTSFCLNKIPKKYILLSMVVFLFIQSTHAQQRKRDSLKKLIVNIQSQHNFTVKDTSYINTLNDFATRYLFYKNDSLLLLSQQALSYSKAMNYTVGQIKSSLNIGNFYSAKGENNKAIFHFKKAMKLAEKIGDYKLLLKLHNSLGIEYNYLDDYAMALREYLEAIEIARKYQEKEMLSILNENIALLYYDLNNFEQALVYLKIAKKINEEINDEAFLAMSGSNLANVYIELGNIEYSMYHINNSIQVFEKHELMDWLAFSFNVKGKIYLKQKKYKWAIFWYNQSQLIHDKNIDDKREETRLLVSKAKAHIGLKNDKLADINAKRAFDMSLEFKFNDITKESAEVLYTINKNRKEFNEALMYHEIFQKTSDSISKNKSEKNLVMVTTKMNFDKQKKNLIITNEKELAKQKNYIYASFGIVLVLCIFGFLVTRSARIQKKLNKELKSKKLDLEKNERELIDINETKTKLFSIIGHDLRGPIGAFQGVLKLYKTGDISKKEFLAFVPKLRADINHIAFTLNNLLSWGQTQMNGSVTRPSIVCMENVVSENINLLSEIANAKSIKLAGQIPENAMVWSDIDQIDIVVRNLISNALKFTPKNGMVTIGALENNQNWEFYVEDTGVGIEIENQNKIFAKNSNISTYGTDNEKGTGLGLMLCKEMIENNKGNIWLKSTPKKGTCFYFTVPKANKKYKKAS